MHLRQTLERLRRYGLTDVVKLHTKPRTKSDLRAFLETVGYYFIICDRLWENPPSGAKINYQI